MEKTCENSGARTGKCILEKKKVGGHILQFAINTQ